MVYHIFIAAGLFRVVFGRDNPAVDLRFDGGWPDTLDYGLYFFSATNVPQKYVKGQNNSLFNPSKSTLIYFHGWQSGSVENGFRETFDYHLNSPGYCPEELVESKSWIQKGWNMGIFYWDQFADEPEPWLAEAKIWSAAGYVGMRYRTSSKHWQTEGVPSGASVTDLCVDAFINLAEASNGQTPKDLRFAGGSLGSQLASHCAAKLQDQASSGKVASAWVPSRVALLEPFFSAQLPAVNEQDYLPHGLTPASATDQAISELQAQSGVIFELYRTSHLSDHEDMFADADEDLRKYAVYVRRYPKYCKHPSGSASKVDSSPLDASPAGGIASAIAGIPFLGSGVSHIPSVGGILKTATDPEKATCEHAASWNLYFLSMGSSPPPICSAPPGEVECTTPSASCSDSALRSLTDAVTGIHRHFVQTKGMDTISIEDDCFELQADQEKEALSDLVESTRTGTGSILATNGMTVPLFFLACLSVTFACLMLKRSSRIIETPEDMLG